MLWLYCQNYTSNMHWLVLDPQALRIWKFTIPKLSNSNFHEARLGNFCPIYCILCQKQAKIALSWFMKIVITLVRVDWFTITQWLWVEGKCGYLLNIILKWYNDLIEKGMNLWPEKGIFNKKTNFHPLSAFTAIARYR